MARDNKGPAGAGRQAFVAQWKFTLRKPASRQPEGQPNLSVYLRALGEACREAVGNLDPRVLATLGGVLEIASKTLMEEPARFASDGE